MRVPLRAVPVLPPVRRTGGRGAPAVAQRIELSSLDSDGEASASPLFLGPSVSCVLGYLNDLNGSAPCSNPNSSGPSARLQAPS